MSDTENRTTLSNSRIIHQVWYGGIPSLPAEQACWMDRLRALNPEFSHRLWTERDIPDTPEPWRSLVRLYLSRRDGAGLRFASVIVRWAAMHQHGGIYLDTDFEPLRPLVTLPEQFIAGNGFFALRPGHPKAQAILQTILELTSGGTVPARPVPWEAADELRYGTNSGIALLGSEAAVPYPVGAIVTPQAYSLPGTVLVHHHNANCIGGSSAYAASMEWLRSTYRLPATVPSVLLLIKSAPGNEDRRTAMRERWLDCLPRGWEYYFCIGDSPSETPEVRGTELHLPVSEGYDNLPFKMKKLTEWVAFKSGWSHFDYILTLDDDVVVNVERLLAFLQDHRPDHFGNRWDGNPAHISGMCVGYSLRAFHVMARAIRSIPDTGADDLLISEAVFKLFSCFNVMTDVQCFKPYGAPVSHDTLAVEIRPFTPEKMRGFQF